MATAEELLSGVATVDKTLEISNDLRTIKIPPSVHILGVESDDEVLQLNFKMPRYIGNIDLSENFSTRINYVNAAGEGDIYPVHNVGVLKDSITFKWLVGPTATRYKGDTKFNVSLVRLDEKGYVDKKYSTAPTSLKVLEGLDVDDSIAEDYDDTAADIIAQWDKGLREVADSLIAEFSELTESGKEEIEAAGVDVLNAINNKVDTAVTDWFEGNDLYTDVSQFGFKYSDKVYEENIAKSASAPDPVTLRLFKSKGGYAAVVSGSGEMKNHSYNPNTSPVTDNRKYKSYLNEINAVYIESGVTSIGDNFMRNGHDLSELVFADSSKITRLGKYCFASTHISGEYEFLNLKHYEGQVSLQSPFTHCPKLTGITIGISDEIYKEGYEEPYKQLVVSESAFKHCYDLKYFKVSDPNNNTWTTLDWGCFELCTELELLEINPRHTTPKGHNFLRVPAADLKVKYHVLDNPDTDPPDNAQDTGRMRCVSLSDMNEDDSWILKYSNNERVTPSLSTITRWKSNKDAYESLLEVRDEYVDRRHQLAIPESDYQSSPQYESYTSSVDRDAQWAIFWGYYGGLFRNPYYGSCYMFSYYHAWNVLHPNHQFDTFDDFVKEKLWYATVTIDHEAYQNLKEEWAFRDDLVTTNPEAPKTYAADYFDEGNTVLIRDLPVSLKKHPDPNRYTQLGVPGEATWAVRKVLGWEGGRYTVSPEDFAVESHFWPDIKKAAIESIFKGFPVLVECVAYHDGCKNSTYANDIEYQGMHQVTAIGYDGKTDKFQIIDSGVAHDPDVFEPSIYWTTFEALLDPSEESAVWIFSKVDSAATVVPINDSIGQIKEEISYIKDDMVNVNNIVVDLMDTPERISSLEDHDSTIDAQLYDLSQSIEDVNDELRNVAERIGSLEYTDSEFVREIDNFRENDSVHAGKLSDHEERIARAESSIGDIDAALAHIIEIQKELMGGDET